MIYGDPVELKHPEPFLESLRNGERKTASAVDGNGNGVLAFKKTVKPVKIIFVDVILVPNNVTAVFPYDKRTLFTSLLSR